MNSYYRVMLSDLRRRADMPTALRRTNRASVRRIVAALNRALLAGHAGQRDADGLPVPLYYAVRVEDKHKRGG